MDTSDLSHHSVDNANSDVRHTEAHGCSHDGVLFFGPNVTMLFKEWTTTNWLTLILSCFGVVFATIIYELLQLAVARLQLTASLSHHFAPSAPSSTSALSEKTSALSKNKPPQRSTRNVMFLLLLQTLLHVIRVAIGYALMLVVMTFNASIYLAVLIGSGIGHLTASCVDLYRQQMTSNAEYECIIKQKTDLKTSYQTCH